MKNKYYKQYEELKKKLIKDIKKEYTILNRKHKNDKDYFKNELLETDSIIFIDVFTEYDEDDFYNARYISDIDLFGVTVDTESWGTVDEFSYKELSFEVLCDLLDFLNNLK